jgi:hypothetical protein
VLRRLWIRLLTAIATTLRRWVEALSAADEAASVPADPPWQRPAHGPPAHWLERVRRDAPQLLRPPAADGAPPRILAQPPEPRLRTRPARDSGAARRAVPRRAPVVREEERDRADATPERTAGIAAVPLIVEAPRRPPVPTAFHRPAVTSRDRVRSAPGAPVRIGRPAPPGSTRIEIPRPLRAAPSHWDATAGDEESAPDRRTPTMRSADLRVPAAVRDSAPARDDRGFDREPRTWPDLPDETPLAFSDGVEVELPVGTPRAVATSYVGERQPLPRPRPEGQPGFAANESRGDVMVPWPTHDADDREPPAPSASVGDARWPELAPDAATSAPDWTPLIGALRRARALEQEQRGDL